MHVLFSYLIEYAMAMTVVYVVEDKCGNMTSVETNIWLLSYWNKIIDIINFLKHFLKSM